MNNIDRELLELAAKAAGIGLSSWSEIEEGYRCKDGGYFRPLTDDGDALRLMVKLKLDVEFGMQNLTVSLFTDTAYIGAYQEPYQDDPYAATRRTIVRAAAELGKKI